MQKSLSCSLFDAGLLRGAMGERLIRPKCLKFVETNDSRPSLIHFITGEVNDCYTGLCTCENAAPDLSGLLLLQNANLLSEKPQWCSVAFVSVNKQMCCREGISLQ